VAPLAIYGQALNCVDQHCSRVLRRDLMMFTLHEKIMALRDWCTEALYSCDVM